MLNSSKVRWAFVVECVVITTAPLRADEALLPRGSLEQRLGQTSAAELIGQARIHGDARRGEIVSYTARGAESRLFVLFFPARQKAHFFGVRSIPTLGLCLCEMPRRPAPRQQVVGANCDQQWPGTMQPLLG